MAQGNEKGNYSYHEVRGSENNTFSKAIKREHPSG